MYTVNTCIMTMCLCSNYREVDTRRITFTCLPIRGMGHEFEHLNTQCYYGTIVMLYSFFSGFVAFYRILIVVIIICNIPFLWRLLKVINQRSYHIVTWCCAFYLLIDYMQHAKIACMGWYTAMVHGIQQLSMRGCGGHEIAYIYRARLVRRAHCASTLCHMTL